MKVGIIGAALCLSACATTASPPVAPPRLQMPSSATEPCSLYRLPEQPTLADLEVALAARGAALVDCDGRRRLAVETAQAEHDLQDQWRTPRPTRKRLFNLGTSGGAAGSRP
jgi:hypothetical protein